MLWQAQHGATAHQYRADCQARGVTPPAYLIPPAPLPGIDVWHIAFWELATERRFPGGPIPVSAIDAWPVAGDEADLFRHAIRRADAAYLEFISRPPEERQSPAPLSPAAFRRMAEVVTPSRRKKR